MADPVRDLNNFLQGQPGGSATKDFQWLLTKEGPEHDTIYHITAVCKPPLQQPLDFIHSCTTVRGANVELGHGSTKGIAKHNASVQALEYLKMHGTMGILARTSIGLHLTHRPNVGLRTHSPYPHPFDPFHYSLWKHQITTPTRLVLKANQTLRHRTSLQTLIPWIMLWRVIQFVATYRGYIN